MKRILLALCLLLLATLPVRAQIGNSCPTGSTTCLWAQPGSTFAAPGSGITDIMQIVKVDDQYPDEGDQTWLMMYNLCAGNTQPQRISGWNLSPYTNVGAGWTPLTQYLLGCGQAAWSNATQAKGAVIGILADDTSIEPPNQGQDLWLTYGWDPASMPQLGPNLTIFQGDLQIPWYWLGKENADGSWTTVNSQPFGFGGAWEAQLYFFDYGGSGQSFYTNAPAFSSAGQGFAQPTPGIDCGIPGLPQAHTAFGTNNRYGQVYGTYTQQGMWTTWTGWLTFAYSFTPIEFQNIINDINSTCNPTTNYSTNPANYYISSLAWGFESLAGKKNCNGVGPNGYCWGVSLGGATKRAVLMVQ